MLKQLGILLWVLLASFSLQANDLLSKLQGNQFLPVDQAFVFDFVQQDNTLKISWQIADGYYLYKDKFKLAGVAVNFSHPTYPPGMPYEDEYFGKTEIYLHQVVLSVPLSNIDKDAVLKVRYQGCAKAGLCYPVQTKEIPLFQPQAANTDTTNSAAVLSDITGDIAGETNHSAADTASNPDSATTSNTKAPVSSQVELAGRLTEDRSLWTLGLFFLLGLGLAFTPCVFPMYPILTSIIAGQGQQLSTGRAFRLSMAYVQGMAITYSLLGLVVASAGVQFQAYFQHPAVLIGISILFVLLALAMFGVLTLQLPGSWQEKVGGLSNKQQGGSLKGALTMGALSGLVASPCTTAPLTGVLLYIAQSGDMAYGALVLYVLSMGMGLPLLLIGSSGGKWLPKPGAWMDVIKAGFGFLLLSVPLVLLERIVPDKVLIVLASLLAICAALFLHTVQQQLQKPVAKAICWLLATLLVVATFSWNLKFWFAPVSTAVVATSNANSTNNAEAGKFIDIKTLADLDSELEKAKAANQYVMLDLFAEWCVACKEFEHITFADTGVKTEMAKIRLLRIDVTKATEQDQQVLDKFSVLGLPTLLFFAPNGSELTQSRVTGFMPPAEFQAHLQQLNQG
ncbi:protein-disulfide reductase DsbD [Rheinheimera sp.]|uniref:protein-disulfide reductase DsbD n=1 Tax=Rheinheimera sp. TaxID=1869214 RepID=UPI0027BA5657|nr:protein-disulfide reductase DsbD [Rheinheimera sp.]